MGIGDWVLGIRVFVIYFLMPLTLNAAADDDGRRLDRIIRKALRDMPLSAIHRLLRQGSVLVDGEKKVADYRVRSGQLITINQISVNSQRPEGANGESAAANYLRGINSGEKKPEIIFEGSGILILNKPAGIAVHGKDSLEDQALSYLRPKLPPSLSFRPGPLHRLDKPSSGLVAFSTSLEGARFFSELLRERKVTKQYLAIVEGVIGKAEVWQDELTRDHEKKKTFIQTEQAKTALTKVTPLASDSCSTLILAEIETGRTHQIRAQAAAHGRPLLGDKKYGGKTLGDIKNQDDFGFLLHSWRMGFPETTALPRLIEAPLPERFRLKIRELFGEWGSGR